MKHRLLLLPFAAALAFAPLPALAQMNENAAVAERMDRLEHDIMLLQKQVSQGAPITSGGGASDTVPVSSNMPIDNPAQLEVRLSAIDDELRNLRGRVEQSEFQNKKNSDAIEKMQKDIEYRFNELQNAPKTAGAPVATAMPAGTTPPKPLAAAAANDTGDGSPEETTAGDGKLHTPSTNTSSFTTPRDLYNYAFRLLNETKYEEAASAFDTFTKKYAKDPLVGNAYYWEGETFYIRRDYVSAADNFRQGFEALPDGPKAADNLLKLAMSLNALNRDKEACVVLGQITTKFKKSSTSITEKAIQEQKRIGCS